MARLLKAIGILLGAAILLIVAAGLGAYLYLAPESPDPATAAPGSLRTITEGEVLGAQDAHDTYVWKGLPFARPPTGDLRWRAPGPSEPWAGRREALEFGQQCVQLGNSPAGVVGDEDCLYLNVWSPITGAVATGTDRRPVMFWIHGGGNSIGSAHTDIYNGAFLAGEHDVVVVSIHYRLGPLGWFRHPAVTGAAGNPADASGNFGTLDIVAALRWVNRNIGAFGGDLSTVTIFGESAGGFNVLSMLASPRAAGLFHRAISQSGGLALTSPCRAESYTEDGGHRYRRPELANLLMVYAGTATDRAAAKAQQDSMPPAQVEALLRSAPAADLYASLGAGFGGMIGNPDLFGDGYVLPAGQTIYSIFEAGNHNPVPVMLGTNRDETKLFAMMGPGTEKLFGVIPRRPVDPIAWKRDNRYGSDLWKARAVDELADRLVTSQSQGVFAYRFDVDEWRDLGVLDFKPLLAAAHALEIPFIFGNFPKPLRILFPDSRQNEFELISSSMASYWTAFARDGEPGTGHAGTEQAWTGWSTTGPSLMVFDTTSDGGIRLERKRTLFADVKHRFMSDSTYPSAEAHCQAYRGFFRSEQYNAAEHARLGSCAAGD